MHLGDGRGVSGSISPRNGLSEDIRVYIESARAQCRRLQELRDAGDSEGFLEGVQAMLAKSAEAQNRVQQEALDAGDYERYLRVHDHYERFGAFLEIEPELWGREYWRVLAFVWTHTDVIYPDLARWRELFADSERPGREHLMAERERARLTALPDVVRVYRGFGNPGGENGIAWTTSRDRALFFARFAHGVRMLGSGVRPSGLWVASADVPRERIVAVFDDRGEDEVIILDVKDLVVSSKAVKEIKRMVHAHR